MRTMLRISMLFYVVCRPALLESCLPVHPFLRKEFLLPPVGARAWHPREQQDSPLVGSPVLEITPLRGKAAQGRAFRAARGGLLSQQTPADFQKLVHLKLKT